MRQTFLPFALPDTDDNEITEIAEAIRSGWVTTGPKTRQFEAEFAAAVGAAYAVAVNSCTAAMHLALEAIGLQAGDLVITTPYTFAATAEVIRYFNATPIFVDVEPETLNINPDLVAEAVEALGRGPIRPAKGGPRIADRWLPPAMRGGRPAVTATNAAPGVGKGRRPGLGNVTGAFGGRPPAARPEQKRRGGDGLAERCRIMALHGISKDAWKRYTAEGSWYYEIIAPGYKYNMTDLAAAMGLAQLGKAERMWRRRREIARRYNEAFGATPELQSPADRADCQHAWHLYLLRLNLAHLTVSRNRFIEALKARNIGTSVHFIPLHLHPYYRETYGYKPAAFPVAYHEFQRAVSLPIYSKMSDADVADVIEAVLEVVAAYRVRRVFVPGGLPLAAGK